jgi:predicted Co/Zn/Cd cation transporter (cation efflux family)
MISDAKTSKLPVTRDRLLKRALLLARLTVFYNLAEGVVAVLFGLEDETLSLFGFGLDSFVEVISGIGIWHMVRRMQDQTPLNTDAFERNALRITGSAFYLLTIGLILTAAVDLYQGHRPETTFWGIVIAMISIVTMAALIHFKKKVGRQLQSDAIIADANCTRACLYLSFVLLAASAGYAVTGIGGLDSIGAVAIALFAFREGKEAFEKARGKACSCVD